MKAVALFLILLVIAVDAGKLSPNIKTFDEEGNDFNLVYNKTV